MTRIVFRLELCFHAATRWGRAFTRAHLRELQRSGDLEFIFLSKNGGLVGVFIFPFCISPQHPLQTEPALPVTKFSHSASKMRMLCIFPPIQVTREIVCENLIRSVWRTMRRKGHSRGIAFLTTRFFTVSLRAEKKAPRFQWNVHSGRSQS